MLRALFFDFNGVILDDEPIHMMLFQEVLRDEAISLTQEEYYSKYLGMDDVGCFQAVCHNHGKKVSENKIEELVNKKSVLYDAYIKDHLEFFPKSIELLQKAKSLYKVGIVSGALKHEIEFALDKANAKGSFDVLVAQEDVERGKPDPEGYLSALKKVNALLSDSEKPILEAECLVIEDSIDGIRSAKTAGMRVAAVAHTYEMERLTSEADWVFQSIKEVELAQLEEHF